MTDRLQPAGGGGPTPRRRRRRGTVGFLAIGLLVFALLAGWLHFFAPRSAPPGVTMADLHGVADLKARFNAERGLPRLVVIFSPT